MKMNLVKQLELALKREDATRFYLEGVIEKSIWRLSFLDDFIELLSDEELLDGLYRKYLRREDEPGFEEKRASTLLAISQEYLFLSYSNLNTDQIRALFPNLKGNWEEMLWELRSYIFTPNLLSNDLEDPTFPEVYNLALSRGIDLRPLGRLNPSARDVLRYIENWTRVTPIPKKPQPRKPLQLTEEDFRKRGFNPQSFEDQVREAYGGRVTETASEEIFDIAKYLPSGTWRDYIALKRQIEDKDPMLMMVATTLKIVPPNLFRLTRGFSRPK